MLKKILLALILIISSISILTTLKIEPTYNSNPSNVNLQGKSKIIKNLIENPVKKEEPYGQIIIDSINLNEHLYPIDSKENNVDKHVTILKESIFPKNNNKSIIFIAAHSGTGPIAYFEKLNKVQINDIITIMIEQKKYTYRVKEMWEDKKTGYININKGKENQLVLTTCSPDRKGYQLIVNCIEKESN